MKKTTKKHFKQQRPDVELKQKIYSEKFSGVDVTLHYAIHHPKGLVGYALTMGKDLILFSLDIEKIFDECTPKSRGIADTVDLIDAGQARLAYTKFKEKMLPKSTYLSNVHWYGRFNKQ